VENSGNFCNTSSFFKIGKSYIVDCIETFKAKVVEKLASKRMNEEMN
jgi:tRNA A37 threonylcarbamoyladenosine dehydratase